MEKTKKKAGGKSRKILDQNLADLAQAQGPTLCRRPVYGAHRPPGDGRGRQGRDDQACHVRCRPQGCQVFSFKKPVRRSSTITSCWRYMRCLPERGRIGDLNRSYYEEHPGEGPPATAGSTAVAGRGGGKKFWRRRSQDIHAFQAAPRPERDGCPQVLPEHVEGAEAAASAAGSPEHWNSPRPTWRSGPTSACYMRAYADCRRPPARSGAVVGDPADHKWVHPGHRRRHRHHRVPVAGPEVSRGDHERRWRWPRRDVGSVGRKAEPGRGSISSDAPVVVVRVRLDGFRLAWPRRAASGASIAESIWILPTLEPVAALGAGCV